MSEEIKAAVKEAMQECIPKEYMTVEEWAEYQGISRPYAYQLVRRKDFPPVTLRMGKRNFIIRKLWDEHAEKLAKQRVAM